MRTTSSILGIAGIISQHDEMLKNIYNATGTNSFLCDYSNKKARVKLEEAVYSLFSIYVD